MAQELYSVEQVAARLNLHVRTVRNYVRTGRLKATRIGKQYRIAGSDLESFTGSARTANGLRARNAGWNMEVSTVALIDGVTPELANRLTTLLLGAAKGRRGDNAPSLRLDAIYSEEHDRLKLILSGDARSTAEMLKMATALLEE
jgi:excisionase family DNA binding protein